MTTAFDLLQHCRRAGISLQRTSGGRLRVAAPANAEPEARKLLGAVRFRRGQIIALLDEEQAWVPTARQIVRGEFDRAPAELLAVALLGLKDLPHPICQQARRRLAKLLRQAP
jgi:hypothetical protein